MKKCKYPACLNVASAHGLCGKHYMRLRRYGDASITKKRPNGSGSTRRDGYRAVTIDGVRQLEHRLIMEKKLKRKLLSTEVVHHVNENRGDNRLKNLEITNTANHLQFHNTKHPISSSGKTRICAKCGKRRAIAEFPTESRIKMKHRSECRLCKNARNRRYYHHIKFLKPEMYRLTLSKLNKLT